jgi:hypothetical protein
MQQHQAGVGITFRQLASGGFIVVKISSGGPSNHKGILPGDVLQLVDRREVCIRVWCTCDCHFGCKIIPLLSSHGI